MADRLTKLFDALDGWCREHWIDYDITMDEDDLQAYLIFERQRQYVPQLLKHLRPLLVAEGIQVKAIEVRSGIILAFSVDALSEDVLEQLGGNTFERALDAAFAEQQYHWPTHTRRRYQHRAQNYHTYELDSSDPDADATRRFEPGVGPVTTIGQLIRPLPTRRNRRRRQLPVAVREDMQGIAAHAQPGEMLKALDRAMRDAGLHAALQAAGIANKLSDDRQRIIFYMQAANGSQQPIIAFDLVDIGEGSKMKDALKHLMDLSQQHAPGESDMELKRLQDKERAIGDIADKYMPRTEEPVDQQLAAPMPAVESFRGRVAAIFDAS
jgi:hypothetical protein